MITSDELMSHAARCTRLAEASKDKAVAEKFRQLARDYCDLATTRGTPDYYQCINDFEQITGANDRHLSQVCRNDHWKCWTGSVAELTSNRRDAVVWQAAIWGRNEIHFRGELVWTKPFADGVSDNTDAQAEALLAQFADKYNDPGK